MFRQFARSVKSFFLSIFGSREAVARLAVEAATLAAIDRTALSGADVVAAVDIALLSEDLFADGDQALREKVYEAFGYDRRSSPERLTIDALITAVLDAASVQLRAQVPTVDAQFRVVLGWVREAAASAN